MKRIVKSQSLAAVFLLACLAFNYPLLYVFDVSGAVLGIPALYLYLFVAWGVVVALLAYLAER